MFSDAIIEPLQKTFAFKGSKITGQKKVYISTNFALQAEFFSIGVTICNSREMLCLPYAGYFGFYSIRKNLFFLACFRPRKNSIFKLPVTISLQYLASLKLGVTTEFVLGLPLDIQRVFEQKKITYGV